MSSFSFIIIIYFFMEGLLVTLIKKRLAFGPAPKKDTIPVRDLLLKWGFTGIVNLRKRTEYSHYYMEDKKKYPFQATWAMEMNDREPPSKQEFFAFVHRIVSAMRANSKLNVYVHCYDGKICSAAVALTCWYWLMPPDKKPNPIQAMRQLGRHDTVKSKEYRTLITETCKRDNASMHAMMVPITECGPGKRKRSCSSSSSSSSEEDACRNGVEEDSSEDKEYDYH